MRTTPSLLIMFILVAHRWIETQTGWPEWLTFPFVGLGGALLLNQLVLPSTARLDLRAWSINLGVAVAVGTALFAAAR